MIRIVKRINEMKAWLDSMRDEHAEFRLRMFQFEAELDALTARSGFLSLTNNALDVVSDEILNAEVDSLPEETE